jgi:hypothetical protein
MKKLLCLVLFVASPAIAGDSPEKVPGGSMPDRPEGGTMAGKAEGGTLPEASFAKNTSCTVDGTWFSLLPPSPKMPEGKEVTATFSNGSFSAQAADGKKTASYTVSGSSISFSKGNTGKPPKGASDEARAACDAGGTGTYDLLFTSDCSSMKMSATADSCEPRKRVMEGSTYRRAKK